MYVCGNKSNLWIDFRPVENIKNFVEDVEGEILIDNTPNKDWRQFFHDLYEYEKIYGYKRKKYRIRQAVSLVILLPQSLKEEDIQSFIIEVMKDVLSGCNLNWMSWLLRKGKGRYVTLLISERKFFEEEKEIQRLSESDGYKSSVTKRYCASDDPNAYLFQQKGTVLKSWKSHFSDKYRIFTFPKKLFNQFREKVKRILVTVLIDLNVVFQKKNFFTQLKRKKNYTNARHQNLTDYNLLIQYMNSQIQQMENMVYSDACYYQVRKNIDRVNSLFHKYRQRLKNGSFKHLDKVTLNLSIFINFIQFRENIETFKDQFEEDFKTTFELIVNS